MPGVTTLKRISKLSGRSISTVSKALNNKTGVSAETRIRIQELAQHYNYRPNPTAVALRKKSNKTLAVLVPDLSVGPVTEWLRQVQELCFDAGYKLCMFQSLGSHPKEQACLKWIQDGTIDGVILCLNHQAPSELNIPAVRIDLVDLMEQSGAQFEPESVLKRLLAKLPLG